jgi:hypothetical protein
MKYLADLSNRLVGQLQFVDIVAKPVSVFGNPLTKEEKAAESRILPEVTEDTQDPQGGLDSIASNIQSRIRRANASGEMQLAKNIYSQADHIYTKMIQRGYRKDYVGLPLLASMQEIREWCQKWARQVITDSKLFRSPRQSEMTVSLLNSLKVFFKDFLDPMPHITYLQHHGLIPNISRDDLNPFVWGLLDYADLEKLANYAEDLALEPVQQCAHDEKYIPGIIHEQISQIRERLSEISKVTNHSVG